MFEFSDEKLGRFKVINITEARASMATIMGDKEFNYIVTKNNHPVRVIINYDTYKKNQTGSLFRSLKGSEARDLLKGLIESKEKDLRRQISKEDSPVMQNIPVESPLAVKTDVISDKRFPVNNGEVSEVKAPPVPNQIEVCDEVSGDLKGTEEVISPAPYTPPPDNDYFNRFKKLYEPPRYNSFTGIVRGNEKRSSDGTESPETKSPEAMSQAMLSPETISTNQGVSANPLKEKTATTPLKPSISFKSSNPNDPPSIQDLLMELEGEKLSGDDNPLSTDQVHQLLNRITK